MQFPKTISAQPTRDKRVVPSSTAPNPNHFRRDQPAFSLKDLDGRAIDFQIVPALDDESRLIRAVNAVLKNVNPRIGCFCISTANESRLYLFHLDPALFEDRNTLEALGKELLGVERPTAGGTHELKVQSVAKALVSPGLRKGDRDTRHSVVIDGIPRSPNFDNETKKSTVTVVEASREVDFVGDGVSVRDRTISVYVRIDDGYTSADTVYSIDTQERGCERSRHQSACAAPAAGFD